MAKVVCVKDVLEEKEIFSLKSGKFKKVYDSMKFSYSLGDFSSVVSKFSKFKNLKLFKFESGDYTLMFDKMKKHSGKVMILDLYDFDEKYGGYISFVRSGKEVFRITGKKNVLNLIDAKNTQSFIKYVNHYSSKPRIFLYGELTNGKNN